VYEADNYNKFGYICGLIVIKDILSKTWDKVNYLICQLAVRLKLLRKSVFRRLNFEFPL